MRVLGIYGSPRRGGNTDILLGQCLDTARSAGADVHTIVCCDLTIDGCAECGGCDETGECVIQDDMDAVYPELESANAIVLATPIFFYGVTAQAKALIDRCQAMWCRNRIRKRLGEDRVHPGGQGYLIAAGATRGANLFQGAEMTAKYFYDALDMSYNGGVFVRKVEAKEDILKQPEALEEASKLGKDLVLREL